ncbi:major facilitator superfamily domain-containing protein [Xylariaceae sp. FL0016]|nr:major facilitator superfamily domain-containing protein [Xylariaceae sp. FL0016]
MELHMKSSFFGQVLRWLSGNRVLKHPDELDPSLWEKAIQPHAPAENKSQDDEPKREAHDDLPHGDEPKVDTQNDLPQSQGAEAGSGALVVGWYGKDDPENPQNWPSALKHFVAFQMCILNFAVYIASSIYVPGEAEFMKEFGVSSEVAVLGLSLFTFGYGIGPMLWSPLSEMPSLGRTRIFIGTLFAFIIFQLPVGLAPNAPVFLVFRFVTGFCGSPCLATGGGTINDIYPPTQVPYLLIIWQSAGVLGPVFGPVIGGFLAPAAGWRWTIWLVTIFCSAVLILMFFCLPETSADNILYCRAQRLRASTGNDRLKSQHEIDSEHHTSKDTFLMLGRAFTLTFLEPIILLVDLYAGLLYGVLFIWFESFPLVFGDVYGFSTGEQGLVFLSILVFTAISMTLFIIWLKKSLVPKMTSPNFKPEMVLPPTFIGCFALPICLFWFGWTSRPSVHWMIPTIGSGFFAIGVVTLFNSVYTYIGMVYAPYAASVFAGAALFRASLGGAFPLLAQSLFDTLGIGPGNSLLGGLAILFIPVPFIFYHYGERIRHLSKRAG